MVPEKGEPITSGTLPVDVDRPDVNVIDAAARGASEGLRLALVVAAMLIAFIALVSLANGVVGWVGGHVGLPGLTLPVAPAHAAGLDPRSIVIAIYALASFANFSSIAMTIAGVGEIAPSRRHDLAKLGIKAMVAGLLAALMTAALAGILV